jgi:hypothetical protein
LVPRNKIGKCLCQHPRDCKGYHNGSSMHGSKICLAEDLPFSSVPLVHAV